MPWGAIIGAGIGAVGGILGNKSSAKEAEKSREMSIEAAKNKHQWEVRDLKKAGLNPILSANSGASLSSLPSAGQANPFQGAGDTINAARKLDEVEKKVADSTIDLQQASAMNQEKQAGASQSQQHLNETNELLSAQNRDNARAQNEVIQKTANLVEAQTQREQAGVMLNSAQAVEALSRKNLNDKQSKLTDYEINAKEYGKGVERYTEPANKIIDTGERALDAINPVRAFRNPRPRRQRP